MKAILGLVLALVACSSLWAQGDSPECKFCNGVRDYGCLAVQNITSREGCTSINFTPPCDGTFTLTAKSECTGSYQCCKCMAVAMVYDGDTQVGLVCHVGACFNCGLCSNTCQNSVTLTGGHQYMLWVCLRPCSDSQCGSGAITDCDTNNCSAVGYVMTSDGPICPTR